MTVSFYKTARFLEICLLCLSMIFFSSCAYAEKNKDTKISSRHLDTAPAKHRQYTPERIILNLTEIPAVSQAVTWRTISKVASPQAQIVPASES